MLTLSELCLFDMLYGRRVPSGQNPSHFSNIGNKPRPLIRVLELGMGGVKVS